MEAMLGETGEGNREEGANSSSGTGSVCVNGDVNGTHVEGLVLKEMCNVNRHNSVTFKMVSNKCPDKSSYPVNTSLNAIGTRELKEGDVDNKLDTSDKVPKSEPASVCRDVDCEVPGVGKSVSGDDEKIPSKVQVTFSKGKDVKIVSTSTTNLLSNTVGSLIIKNCDESVNQDCESSGACNESVSEESDITKKKLEVSESCDDVSVECANDVTSVTDDKQFAESEKCGGLECSDNLENVNKLVNSTDLCGSEEVVKKLKHKELDDIPQYEERGGIIDSLDSNKGTDGVAYKSDSGDFHKTDNKCSDNAENGISSPNTKEGRGEGQEPTESSDSKPEEPAKVKKSRKSVTVMNLTPRRSSRNLNKQKSYVEKEDEPEIQEIPPVDPLSTDPLSVDPLRDDKENSKARTARKNTIVVNDTKRLVEIATGSKGIKGGKKEPTLVIIDTNSILSGRGPVPVSQGNSSPGPSSISPSTSSSSSSSASGFSVLPIALPAQGLYPPICVNSPLPATLPPPVTTIQTRPSAPPQILPTLTDDMYVVEAPSFIVPYVYEKPPIKPLKEYLEHLEKEIAKDMKDTVQSTSTEKKSEQELSKEDETEEVKDVLVEKKDIDDDNDDDGAVKNESDNPQETSSVKEGDANENSGDSELPKLEDRSLHENKNLGNSSNVGEKDKNESKQEESNKATSYFDNPLGKFFMHIGINLVQEYVQTDLLRSQKRKREREGKKGTPSTQFAINSLVKNLEFSKENNEPFHLEQKKCEYCSFKTESSLVMAQHLETPHMRNYVYRCNFCPLEVRSPHDILFHMEAEHNVRGRLERAPAFHQCPNCPFEDSQKGKLTRHMLSCAKKHKPDRNQEPPPDWEPPAKIPRLTRSRPTALGLGAAAYQAMAAKSVHPLLPKLVPGSVLPPTTGNINRGRGRPPIHGRYVPQDIKTPQRPIAPTQIRQGMMYRPGASTGQPQVLLPTTYQIAGSQVYQSTNKNPTAKLLQQPSISITPLPRQPAGMAPGTAMHSKHVGHSGHPGHSTNKATFVICEICDGYIKDLEQLRNHMQWIHKVKIHPKMIYNRPPLNCQKCQFRFFTDQGLERHLLGSHGLVTSSMQEAANKGKDGGRCPVCGRVYQWKLLNHVARDHNMSLKPAHLSYKCTVCTATFGMYKQFENHVYSAHSVVAKRVIDKKSPQVPRPQSSETLLKPLKINDEITIIPQPARPRPGPASRTGAVSAIIQQSMGPKRFKQRLQQRQNVQVIELEDSPVKKDKATDGSGFQENGEDTLNAVKERLRRRKSLEISQVDSECSSSHLSEDAPAKKRRRNDDE